MKSAATRPYWESWRHDRLHAAVHGNQRATQAVVGYREAMDYILQRRQKPWIRFCLTGHYVQAQTLLHRMRELERLYAELSDLVIANGLPDRMALALIQAAFGTRVRNSSYRVSADVSKNLASRDLKVLVDAGLLVPEGERRGRFYSAAPIVAEIRQKLRLPKKVNDPFAEGGLAS